MGLFRKKDMKQTQSNQEANGTKQENCPPSDQQVMLTLYACTQKKDFTPYMLSCFKEVILEQKHEAEEFTLFLQDHSKITFYEVSQEEEKKKQIDGMKNFYAQAPFENETLHASILQQIQLFNTIIGVTFTINDDTSRTNYLVEGIYRLAKEIQGFVLHPSMELFHFEHKLLISMEGTSDYETFYPIASSDILDSDIQMEEVDERRKERSLQRCKEKQIPYAQHLKVSVTQNRCMIPSKEDMIHRFACVFFTAVTAEICITEKENAKAIWDNMNDMVKEAYHVYDYLTEEERAYVSNPFNQSDEAHAKFGWRYECCAIFLWALRLMELNEPTQICEVSKISEVIWSNDFSSLCEKSDVRTKDEILDMQDFIFRCDWACVEARIQDTVVEGLDAEIIYEWHYALNWLTTAGGIENWDEVCPNT